MNKSDYFPMEFNINASSLITIEKAAMLHY